MMIKKTLQDYLDEKDEQIRERVLHIYQKYNRRRDSKDLIKGLEELQPKKNIKKQQGLEDDLNKCQCQKQTEVEIGKRKNYHHLHMLKPETIEVGTQVTLIQEKPNWFNRLGRFIKKKRI